MSHISTHVKCDPCERDEIPKRLSCCDCIYLTKIGCIPHCGLRGHMVPLPNLFVCSSHTGSRRDNEICRRCCGDDPNCGITSGTSDCCSNGENVNSCKTSGPPEKNDIWCHMRCSSKHTSNICRRCCGDDVNCGLDADDSCKCCMTIQQRMNF